MVAIDTNILMDLLVSNQPGHEDAWNKLGKLDRNLAVTSVNLAECLQLLTHEKVFPNPMSIEEAVKHIGTFLDAYDVIVIQEAGEWWYHLSELAEEGWKDFKGNDVFDAQVAFCLKHNGIKTIWTRDSDFQKYSFLKVVG